MNEPDATINIPPSEQDIRNRLLVARLPALPHIIVKLLEYCRSDNVGMAELAEIIAKDPAIAAKILGVANSSAFHRNGQKVRLEQSLISLGTDMIRTLAISESVFQTFNGLVASSRINLRGFWKHSLTAAVLARDIAKKNGLCQYRRGLSGRTAARCGPAGDPGGCPQRLRT